MDIEIEMMRKLMMKSATRKQDITTSRQLQHKVWDPGGLQQWELMIRRS
jgi:hypothetical protein